MYCGKSVNMPIVASLWERETMWKIIGNILIHVVLLIIAVIAGVYTAAFMCDIFGTCDLNPGPFWEWIKW